MQRVAGDATLVVTKNTMPTLAICIPTFNRAPLLNNLLRQLYEFDDGLKSKIQICISDNASTDATATVINDWTGKLGLIAIRQHKNIGGSRNFQAVSALARAPWVLLMGDDDLFLKSGLENLISLLTTLEKNTWVLADIRNEDGSTLLGRFSAGIYTRRNFQKDVLLRSLLDSLGYMSMHVIPRDSVDRFIVLGIDDIYTWPPLGLLFRELPFVNLFLHKDPIVLRGGDYQTVTQSWRANDWLQIMMQKTKLCSSNGGGFSNALALREYFRWAYARQTMIVMSEMQSRQGLGIQASRYIETTNISFLTKRLISLYVFVLTLMPICLVTLARRLKNIPRGEVAKSIEQHDAVTDGVDRGL